MIPMKCRYADATPSTPAADAAKVKHTYVPVAQLDRASASGAEGYRFEPYRERLREY